MGVSECHCPYATAEGRDGGGKGGVDRDGACICTKKFEPPAGEGPGRKVRKQKS